MQSYTGFAQVYDTFMDNVPYQEWSVFLASHLKQYGVDGQVSSEKERSLLQQEQNTVLDLGCGTGTLTELLAKMGYDMIGVDNASEMLEIAMEKTAKSGSNILYLNQDMRELELYGTVGAVVSVCDSLNYLLEKEDLVRVFSKVNNYLYPGGIFLFDFNTVYKYETVIGDTTIAENREDCSFIWENYYHKKEQINEYDLTIFVKQKPENLYQKFSETHYQRGYTLQEMQKALEKAGLKFIEAIDADTQKEVTKKSERVYLIAKEYQKSSL